MSWLEQQGASLNLVIQLFGRMHGSHTCKAMKVANFNADFKRREHRSARRDLGSCEKKACIFSSQQHKLRLLLQ